MVYYITAVFESEWRKMKRKNLFQEDFLDSIPEVQLEGLDDLDFDLDFDGNVEKDLCIQGFLVSKPKKFADIPKRKIKAENAIPLAEQLIAIKEENSFVNCLIPGNFVFCDLLEAIANIIPGGIDLDIATLSYSYENVETFSRMFENKTMNHLSLVVSDYFYAHERRGVYRYTLDTLPLSQTDIAVAGIHSKIHLIADTHGNYYSLEGSANLRSSQNVEQFVFIKSKDVYDFHKKWIAQLLDKYSVIKKCQKTLRGASLWEFITQKG